MNNNNNNKKNVFFEYELKYGQKIQLIDCGNKLNKNNFLYDSNCEGILISETSSNIELEGSEIINQINKKLNEKNKNFSLEEQCKKFIKQNGSLDTVTKLAFIKNELKDNLKFKYFIFGAGPVWKNGKRNEQLNLAELVYQALEDCNYRKLNSLAMDALGSNLFSFPLEKSLEVIFETICKWSAFRKFPYTNHFEIYIKNNLNNNNNSSSNSSSSNNNNNSSGDDNDNKNNDFLNNELKKKIVKLLEEKVKENDLFNESLLTKENNDKPPSLYIKVNDESDHSDSSNNSNENDNERPPTLLAA
jgi:O-acetyl-ADP-ribose deacetylase (regulator of RNase III)